MRSSWTSAAKGQKKFADEVISGFVPTEDQEVAYPVWVEAREINRYLKAAEKADCHSGPS